MRTCDRSNGIMIAMVLYLCTLFIYKDFGIRMIIGYAVFGIAIVFLALKYGMIRISRDTSAFLIIAGAVILAYFRPTARYDKDTISYALTLCLSVLCVLLAKFSSREYRHMERIVLFFAAVFAIIVLLSRINRDLYMNTIYPLLSEEAQEEAHFDLWHGYSSPIGGDVTFHNYIFMLASLLCVGRMAEKSRRWYIWLLISLLFVVASFLTGRRGEFLVLVVIWAVGSFRIMQRYQRRRSVVIVAVLLLMAIPLLPRFLGSSVLSRYHYTVETFQNGEDFLGGRLELWREALRLFREHPLIGIGWGGYGNYVTETFREAHGNVFNVHNIYLQFLAETGIIGTVLILFGLFGLLFRTLKRLHWIQKKQENVPQSSKQYMAVSLGIQGYFILTGFIDPCFMKYYFWVFYAIAFILQQYAMELCWKAERSETKQDQIINNRTDITVGE